MSLTLDEAVERYRFRPNAISAIELLETASEYHADGMIEDSTLAVYTAEVAQWDTSRPVIEYLDGTADPNEPGA